MFYETVAESVDEFSNLPCASELVFYINNYFMTRHIDWQLTNLAWCVQEYCAALNMLNNYLSDHKSIDRQMLVNFRLNAARVIREFEDLIESFYPTDCYY
jgi:hypothetical protein